MKTHWDNEFCSILFKYLEVQPKMINVGDFLLTSRHNCWFLSMFSTSRCDHSTNTTRIRTLRCFTFTCGKCHWKSMGDVVTSRCLWFSDAIFTDIIIVFLTIVKSVQVPFLTHTFDSYFVWSCWLLILAGASSHLYCIDLCRDIESTSTIIFLLSVSFPPSCFYFIN